MSRLGRPDVPGIYSALGMPEAARTARVARAMATGSHTRGRWVSLAWPAPRRHLNGRPVPRRRTERTGRTWHDQPRDENGRWASREQEAA
ncbi:MAG TPA: hypothetical protein VGR74_08770 [Actinomycetota bacterium]|nr:hypothetical protein [Actinomycetota bacterium]